METNVVTGLLLLVFSKICGQSFPYSLQEKCQIYLAIKGIDSS
jgi:hypothetical protein